MKTLKRDQQVEYLKFREDFERNERVRSQSLKLLTLTTATLEYIKKHALELQEQDEALFTINSNNELIVEIKEKDELEERLVYKSIKNALSYHIDCKFVAAICNYKHNDFFEECKKVIATQMYYNAREIGS